MVVCPADTGPGDTPLDTGDCAREDWDPGAGDEALEDEYDRRLDGEGDRFLDNGSGVVGRLTGVDCRIRRRASSSLISPSWTKLWFVTGWDKFRIKIGWGGVSSANSAASTAAMSVSGCKVLVHSPAITRGSGNHLKINFIKRMITFFSFLYFYTNNFFLLFL